MLLPFVLAADLFIFRVVTPIFVRNVSSKRANDGLHTAVSNQIRTREHIRAAQTEKLLRDLEKFLRRQVGDKIFSVPVVLAADLNTLPGVGVYR